MRNRATVRRALLCCTALAMTFGTPVRAQTENAPFLTVLGRLVFGVGSDRVAIDVPQAVTVLEQEDIDRAQPDTLGDVIENVPGVALVGSESPWGESFNIRGIGGGSSADEPRIVMVINGVPKYYEQYRVGSLFTEPEFFERVEILRGPSSSTLYGSGAIAGVISMDTIDADDVLEPGDNFALRQRLQYTDNGNGHLSTTILAFRPNEYFGAVLGYTFRESDEIEAGNGTTIPGTDGILRSGLASLNFSFGNDMQHGLELSYLTTNSFVNDQIYNLVDATTTWGTNDRDLTDTTTFLNYNFNPSGNDLIDLDVRLSYSETNILQTDRRGFPFSLAGDNEYNYENITFSVENSAEWQGNNWENFLTAGISANRHIRTASPLGGGRLTSHPEGEIERLSFYLQNEFIWNDQFTVIAGARSDSQTATPSSALLAAYPTAPMEDSTTANAFNLALHYQVNDAFAVFGSASYTERAPVIDEIFADRFGYGPSFGLSPEESINYELGVALSFDGILQEADSLAVKAVLFDNHIFDMITGNSAIPGPTVPAYVNLDEVRFQGIEVEASYASDTWYGSLGYARTIGEDIGDPGSANPNLENQIPADTVTLGLGYMTRDGAWDFGWNGTWAQEASYVGFAGTVNTPDYFIHDLYAVFRPQNGALEGTEFRLGVENFTDETYRTHLQSTGTLRRGRSWTFTVSRTF